MNDVLQVPQVRLSGEAKDLIVTCCNEFIHLLASEANTVCEKQSKKLILPDHILLALDNLGFSEYKKDCLEAMKQMQEEANHRKKLSNKLEKSGIPEEELLRQQNQLFAEARKQQELIDNTEDWGKMQQAAQEALQRQSSVASSCSTSIAHNNNNGSSGMRIMHQTSTTSNHGNGFISNPADDEDDNYD